MPSVRKTVREWIRDALLDDTDAEDRVFINRRIPNPEDSEYPMILIYSEPEDASQGLVSEYKYVRAYQVAVEIRAKGDDLDNILDDVAEQIEAILSVTDPDQAFQSFDYLGCEPLVEDEGEELLGSMKMKFTFKYFK
jgi:hypothetical protein